MNDDSRTTVLMAFKPIQGAFQLDGEGDGGQMTLVFDRSEVGAATAVWARFAGKAFEVTFERGGPMRGDA